MAIRGRTQQEIADLLDVRRETVSNWMTGKTTPKLSLEDWDRLAEFLGTSLDKVPRSFAPQPTHTHDPVAKITTYPDA